MPKLIVGLTGGIASGKSQVSRYFKELGVEVIDADEIARELFSADSPHLTTLREEFGDLIFNQDKTLNRKALGSIVFSNPEKLAWLNQMTHPLVAEQILQQLSQSHSPYVILDVPLLIKRDGSTPSYLGEIINRVLVIDVTEETQVKRVIRRDNISKEHAMKIFSTQATTEQRKANADDIIDNNGGLQSLKAQVLKLHDYYLSKSMR
jgi:dephospho-CoA kinase